MIDVVNLTKQYGSHLAVDHISFHVSEHEVLGFLGPNGAGKSTTMNMLTGYLSPTEGSVKIHGIDMFEEPLKAKKCIGYLPEIPPVYTDMTVKEYLRFMYGLKKADAKEGREEHLKKIASETGLTNVFGRLIRNLSKGYRQRVGIAQAMIGDPEILILDEPTVGLDPNQIIEIRNLIRTLGKKHTVLLSSHILQEIEAVADRILIISEGRIVADDTETGLARSVGRKNSSAVKEEYDLIVEGPENEVLIVLSSIPEVEYVHTVKRIESKVYLYELRTNGTGPVRRAIFDKVREKGWRLLGLNGREPSLEEIFIRLTNGRGDVRKEVYTGGIK